MKKFVKYKGKYWIWDGSKDYLDRLVLTDIQDSSKGILAEKNKCKNANKEQVKAIKDIVNTQKVFKAIKELKDNNSFF